MSAWQQLADELSTDAILRGIDEAQGHLIIDILTSIVHADDRVSFLERTELEHLLFEMPWTHGKQSEVDTYIEEAVERASGDGGTDRAERFGALAKDAAGAFGETRLREKVFQMAATIASADLHIHETEQAMLDVLAAAFELMTERAVELTP